MDGFISSIPQQQDLRGLAAEWESQWQGLRPAFEPLRIGGFLDLVEDRAYPVTRIRGGIRAGSDALADYLGTAQHAGISHFAMNPGVGQRPYFELMEELASQILPRSPARSVRLDNYASQTSPVAFGVPADSLFPRGRTYPMKNPKAIDELMAMLGLEIPIVQAPMAGFQGHALASAVCNAGALGSVPGALLAPDALRQELATLSAATARGYNVNFFCHRMPPIDEVVQAAWRARLDPYYKALQISEADLVAAPLRMPFDHAAADVLGELRPRVVSFHFGLPAKDLLDRVHGWGSIVLSSATTVAEARWLEQHGADVIIAQGLEAGGHRASFLSPDIAMQSGTFALLPQIVAAVGVPVIAAGGIADASGVVAALSLGAAAAQIGTSYLLCPEATTSRVHREALRADPPRLTAVTNVFSGAPARGIVNRLMEECGPIDDAVPPFPWASPAIAPLRRKAESLGLDGFSPLWAGQNTSGCREVSAGELTRELASLLDR